MKLCRFELLDDPGTPRSGIFHDGRVFETHGLQPVGIHDLSKLQFLAPIPRPPSIRLFNQERGGLAFGYVNPMALVASGSDVGAPIAGTFSYEVRIGIVAQSGGECLGEEEAESLILGLLPLVCLKTPSPDPVVERDAPIVAGPFIVTSEELPSPISLALTADEGGDRVADLAGVAMSASPGALLARASRGLGLVPGDLVASPPLPGLGGVVALGRDLTVVAGPFGAVKLRA